MRVSLNTIKQYLDFELPPVDELVARINAQLGGVEAVVDLVPKYRDIVIVKVVSAEKHPNADKLSVCMIDDGGVVADVERDENGHVRVVCGAPNVRDGLFAAWLPPRATVPSSYATPEPFILDARDLRGIKSNGMLAAADELDLGSDYAGIIEIDPNEWKPGDIEIKPGVSFAEVYGLDDVLIDIENKMFTHRPDCFGQIGVAREIAGILGHKFASPAWYADKPNFNSADGLELSVVNNAGEKVPRFMAVAIQDVTIKPSPLWLRIELVRLGGKPINNIVDATNYVMLLTAQPTHAYDYDKLRGHMLGARLATAGEKATLLNGKTYELTSDDIVIVDGEGIVGLGGVMGGGNSEVSETTKNIVLECATFDMYTVRKTSMRHGLFTDAVTRFNKGQSPLQNDHILDLLMMSIQDVAGGKQASDIKDVKLDISYEQKDTYVDYLQVNTLLGLNLTNTEVAALLENVEFVYKGANESLLNFSIPFWRNDIAWGTHDRSDPVNVVAAADLAEEIGRLYGYEKLPRELPKRSIAPAPENPMFAVKNHIRDMLSRAGANEVLTYSFVHENLMKKSGQDPIHAYKLGNALSPDLQYYRLSLTPSLLDKVHMNIKSGFDSFAIFEIGKTHYKGEMDAVEQNIPNEDTHVALVIASNNKQVATGSALYHAKRYLEQLYSGDDYQLQALADFDISTDEWGRQFTAPYEPQRSAVLVKDGQIWGVAGEFRSAVQVAFKLPAYSAGFEIHRDVLAQHGTAGINYRPLSRFPSTSQDISLKTASDVSYASLLDTVNSSLADAAGDTAVELRPVSIYQPEGDGATKTTTFHIEFTHHERTLTDSDITPLMDALAMETNKKLGAVRV